MFTLKFTTGIRPTERNMQLARAAQIYYHQGAYSDEKLEDKKPVEQAEQKKPEQKKPVEAVEKKPVEQAEQKKPEQKKPVEQAEQKKPVAEKKPEVKAEKKPETKAEQQKPDKPEDQKKSEQKPVVEPVVEVIDRDGNIVAMLPGVPEEAPKAARTTAAFDINNFVKPAEQKASTKNLGQVKNVDEVYSFIRTNAVLRPFDPMPGYSINEKVAVLKTYANFNGTHPGLDEIQINTLLMVFNSPDLARKMVNCGLDPKQVLGVRKFNEVPAKKYDNNDAYDFAFEYTLAKKKKLVLLLNSIPTYDEKQGWMSAYNISVR